MSRAGADPAAIGIGLAFAGMLVLTLTPVVGRWAELPPTLATVALGAAVLLLVAGAAIGLSAGREVRGREGDEPDREGVEP